MESNIEQQIERATIHKVHVTPFFEVYLNTHRIEKLAHKSELEKESFEKESPAVDQKWTDDGFNFYEIDGKSILSSVQEREKRDYNYYGTVKDDKLFDCKHLVFNSKQHMILANKFPVGNYSGLFVPHFWTRSPQVMTKEFLRLGMQFSNMFYSPYFRVGYNSMGAMASVNHFHWQFWSIKTKWLTQKLPCENSKKVLVGRGDKFHLYEFDEKRGLGHVYPVHALVYALDRGKSPSRPEEFGLLSMVESMWGCVDYLIKSNIPHNIVMNRKEAYLFIRKKQTASKLPIFYGFTDLSGFITLLEKETYDKVTYDQLFKDMNETCNADENTFKMVKKYCKTYMHQSI